MTMASSNHRTSDADEDGDFDYDDNYIYVLTSRRVETMQQ